MKYELVSIMFACCVLSLQPRVLIAEEYFPGCRQHFPTSLRQLQLDRYAERLSAMEEPPLLPPAKDTEHMRFRFLYLRSRDEPVSLRLDHVLGSEWILTIKQANSPLADKFQLRVNRKKTLNRREVHQFLKFFEALGFWELPMVGAIEAEYSMNDGSDWVFEAVEKGRYHFVRRVSPKYDHWISGPEIEKEFAELRSKEGYPHIDRASYMEVNKKLTALGEFLLRLSGLRLSRMY